MSVNSSKILITGAQGFIGKNLKKRLNQENVQVLCTSRQQELKENEVFLDFEKNFQHLNLSGIKTVVHLAGLAHQIEEKKSIDNSLFDKVNTQGSMDLALKASEWGVEHFIFISSIAVFSEKQYSKSVISLDLKPKPDTAYGISKLNAEKKLIEFSKSSRMRLSIIRPPLVYGSHAPGHFGQLARFVKKGLPLPFGQIKNRRSFLAIDNLIDFIIFLIKESTDRNRIYHLCDPDVVSTSQFIEWMYLGASGRSKLLSVPLEILNPLLKVIGKSRILDKLSINCEINTAETTNLVNWTPHYSTQQALTKTMRGWN